MWLKANNVARNSVSVATTALMSMIESTSQHQPHDIAILSPDRALLDPSSSLRLKNAIEKRDAADRRRQSRQETNSSDKRDSGNNNGDTTTIGTSSGRIPRRQIIIPIVNFKNQTLEICTRERIRRSTVVNHDPLWRYMYADARTLPEAFHRGMRVSNDGPCLGYRRRRDDSGVDVAAPYSWLSYSKVLDKSESLARGFLEIGAKPGQSTLIGVYSQNRPEVVITEQACYFFSMVVVSLYDTLGPEACAFILDKTQLQIVVCDKVHRAENLLRQKIDNPRSALRTIVLTDEPSDDLRSKAYDCQVQVIKFDQLIELGYSARDKMPPVFPMYPSPDDLATVCYTSGTSGNPKGAMLTHENIMAATTSSHMLRNCRVRSGDVMLSFLPMAHMYERLAQAIFYSSGGSVGFSRGDVKLLPDDIKSLQPHMLPSVPRLLNRMYDKIMEEVGRNVLKRWLLALAIQAKHAQLKNLTLRNDSLWDDVVFKKLQDQMGGRVKLLLSGSAPMSRQVLHLLRAGLGAMVLEGYGATETSAAACLTMEGDTNADHVGIPVPCNEIKLCDVVEMNIFARENRGEVCIRGHNVFRGYFRDEENTRRSFDKGWFKTGDIGVWNSNGTLTLLDRKKYIVKLDQGAYVTPEKIENVYSRTQYVDQSYVYGDNRKSYLVSVVVPNKELLQKVARERYGLKNVSFEKLCKDEKIVQMIHDDIILEGHKAGLQSFEQAKRIVLDAQQFTIENGLLTPTLKSRRNALKEKYKKEIDKMYDTHTIIKK